MKFLIPVLAALVGVAFAGALYAMGPEPVHAESQAEPEIVRAAKAGDVDRVDALLAQGIQVDTPDWAGWTPLTWAALLLKDDVVVRLVAAGADIEHIAKGGKNSGTPLMMAAKKLAGLKTVRLLLASGADVNGTDQYGRTALILAARYGRMETVEVLLAAGADVTRRSTLKSWRSALYAATSKGHTAVADVLRKAGATE